MEIKKQFKSYERDEYDKAMEDWRKKYPFASIMMSDAPMKDKLKYAEERFCK